MVSLVSRFGFFRESPPLWQITARHAPNRMAAVIIIQESLNYPLGIKKCKCLVILKDFTYTFEWFLNCLQVTFTMGSQYSTMLCFEHIWFFRNQRGPTMGFTLKKLSQLRQLPHVSWDVILGGNWWPCATWCGANVWVGVIFMTPVIFSGSSPYITISTGGMMSWFTTGWWGTFLQVASPDRFFVRRPSFALEFFVGNLLLDCTTWVENVFFMSPCSPQLWVLGSPGAAPNFRIIPSDINVAKHLELQVNVLGKVVWNLGAVSFSQWRS